MLFSKLKKFIKSTFLERVTFIIALLSLIISFRAYQNSRDNEPLDISITNARVTDNNNVNIFLNVKQGKLGPCWIVTNLNSHDPKKFDYAYKETNFFPSGKKLNVTSRFIKRILVKVSCNPQNKLYCVPFYVVFKDKYRSNYNIAYLYLLCNSSGDIYSYSKSRKHLYIRKKNINDSNSDKIAGIYLDNDKLVSNVTVEEDVGSLKREEKSAFYKNSVPKIIQDRSKIKKYFENSY